MREQGGDVRHGRALPDRAGRDGGRVLRRGPPGHASARRHRPGTLGGEKGGGDGYTRSGGKSLLLPPARGQQLGILAVLLLFPVPSRARLFPSLSLYAAAASTKASPFLSLTVLCLFVFLLCKLTERAGSSAPGHCPLRLRKGVQRAP